MAPANKALNVRPIFIEQGLELSIKMAHKRFTDDTNEVLVPYVVSTPGTGKSSIFEALCNKLGYGSISYTIGLKPLEQLSGLPYIDESHNEKRVHWLAPEMISEIWDLSKKFEFSVVLLDDFHLCTPQQQAYGFELFTYHKLHGYEFPKNVRFVLAGNTSTAAGAKQSLSAIMNRMIKIPVRPNRKAWLLNYADANDLNRNVCAFLRNNHNDVYFCEAESCDPTGSPRSWAGLANAIDIVSESVDLSKNLELLKTLAAGCVSNTAATEFFMFYSFYSSVNVEEIFKNGGRIAVADPHEKYPVLIAITDWVCDKVLDFAEKTKFQQDKFPNDYAAICKILKTYGEIIEKYRGDGEGELAALSTHNLIHNKYKVVVGSKELTMLDIITAFIVANVLPGSIIHGIALDKSDKGVAISALAARISK